MWVKTVQKGLVKADVVIRGKAFVQKDNSLELVGIVTELPKKSLAIYHEYSFGLEMPDNKKCLLQKFLPVVVEGDYSPSNKLRADYYLSKYKELESRGLV